MKKKILAAVLSASYCMGAHAADTYVIDNFHTSATFSFKHLGFSTFYGKIPTQGGTITLDRAQKTGSADITFDIKALVTGVPKFNAHLLSKDFFDAESHPMATFKSNKITFEGDAPASMTGDLTIRGITKPVTLKIGAFHCATHPMRKVPACGADATATIKRSDFGLGMHAPAVSDEIPLAIEVEATAQQ